MIDGEKIMVGGEEMILPPLNWKKCKKFAKLIFAGDFTEIMGDMIFEALSRNYPKFKQDDFEERMAPGEILRAFPLLLTLSGFTRGEAPRGSE